MYHFILEKRSRDFCTCFHFQLPLRCGDIKRLPRLVYPSLEDNIPRPIVVVVSLVLVFVLPIAVIVVEVVAITGSTVVGIAPRFEDVTIPSDGMAVKRKE